MKGAKGGKRDQIISKNFHDKIEELKKNLSGDIIEEELEDRIVEPKINSLEDSDIEDMPIVTEIQKDLIEDNDFVKVEEQLKVEQVNEKEQHIEEDREFVEESEQIKQEEIIDEIKDELDEKTLSEETIEQIIENKEDQEQEELVETIIEEEKDEIVEQETAEEENSYQESLVFYELQKMIKQDYYDIKDLEYKIDLLSSKVEQEVYVDEIARLKRELEELLKQFEMLKDKYDQFDITKEFIGSNKLSDSYVENLLSEYKENIKNSKDIEKLLKDIEETKVYIGIIETIIGVEEKKNTLEEKVDSKYEELDIRDEEFKKLEDSYLEVDKINSDIKQATQRIDDTISELQARVNETVKVVNKTNISRSLVPNANKVFNAIAMIATAAMLPNNFKGRVIKATLIAGAINNVAHILEPKEEVTHTKDVIYNDYSSDILSNMNNLSHVNDMIDGAMNNIQDIRKQFEEQFKQYVDLIPEYKELLNNLDVIEKDLEEQKYCVLKYDNQMKKQLVTNNSKKYIKEYEG